MSLVDDVFGSIADPLIDQWGIDAVYLRKSQSLTYDPYTGTFVFGDFYFAGTPLAPAPTTFIPGTILDPATDFVVATLVPSGGSGGESLDFTRTNIRVVPLQISSEELDGDVQMTDIKFLIANSPLGTYYPKVTDMIEYSENGVTRTARVIKPVSYRGDSPVLRAIIARLP
jgi:hypothetical protein